MSPSDSGAQRYDGRVAWITGGANGFGAGAARRLAGLGATVAISDIDADNGAKVAAEIGGTFIPCDVTSYDDNVAAVSRIVDEHGRLDIAFLNAGIASGVGVGDDFDLERYRRAMGVNLDGVVFGMHAALGAMKERGGRIVATASLAGLVATPFDPLYGANKHAVVGMVRGAGAAYAGQACSSTGSARASPTPTSSPPRRARRSRRSAYLCARSTTSSTRSSRRWRAGRAVSAGSSRSGGPASRSGSATCPVPATQQGHRPRSAPAASARPSPSTDDLLPRGIVAGSTTLSR